MNYQQKRQQKADTLETKIIELENRKAEMEEQACYVLADILEKRIQELRGEFIHC